MCMSYEENSSVCLSKEGNLEDKFMWCFNEKLNSQTFIHETSLVFKVTLKFNKDDKIYEMDLKEIIDAYQSRLVEITLSYQCMWLQSCSFNRNIKISEFKEPIILDNIQISN